MGLSREYVAERLGLSLESVRKTEDKSTNHRVSSLARYLDVLGCDLHDLVAANDQVKGSTARRNLSRTLRHLES